MGGFLPAGEHKRRRQAMIDGHRDGLTRRDIATRLGIAPSTLTAWVREHMPDAPRASARREQRLSQAKVKRRLRVAGEVAAAGGSLSSAATQLAVLPSTLRSWLVRNYPGHPLLPVYAPPAPKAERGSVTLRASRDGWLIDCEPCHRRFVRRDRKRGVWLADKHALMHGLPKQVKCRDGIVWHANNTEREAS